VNAKDKALVDEGFGTVGEVMRFLGLSRSKLYELMDRGELQYAKLGRNRRIPWAAVKVLAAQAMVGPGPAA
jgi:excisionase family DNA binding protein